jgi:hypothetical protein
MSERSTVLVATKLSATKRTLSAMTKMVAMGPNA